MSTVMTLYLILGDGAKPLVRTDLIQKMRMVILHIMMSSKYRLVERKMIPKGLLIIVLGSHRRKLTIRSMSAKRLLRPGIMRGLQEILVLLDRTVHLKVALVDFVQV